MLMTFSPHLRSTIFPAFLLAILTAIPGSSAIGKDSEDETAKATATIEIDGVFESAAAEELRVGTEEIETLVIKRILPHGTEVKQGRNVVWFENKDIDKQIRDAELELRLAELALREAEFKHEQFLETQQLDRQAAERTRQRARQDHDNFVQIDRDHQLKSAEFSLKNSQASLENAQEELEQLEKMYRADDLTEESEEIVLKRARLAVENAQFRLEGAEVQTNRALEQSIPRSETDEEEKLKRAELTYKSTLRDLDFARKRRELELDKERRKFADQEAELNDLREERKRLVIAAPVSGFVFHGELKRGALGDNPSTMEAGQSVKADQVVVTVVPNQSLRVRLAVPEEHLQHIEAKTKASVVPNALPDHAFEASVKSLSKVPFAGKKFDCVLSVKLGEASDQIVPAMGCKVEFEKKDDKKNSKDDDA